MTSDKKWMPTKFCLPKEGEVVLTAKENGEEQKLKRMGNLWLLPSEKMYVYYVPVKWKKLINTEKEL